MRFETGRHPVRKYAVAAVLFVIFVVSACVTQKRGETHRWWAGLGPVLPHDSFPADCNLCHVGGKWDKLVDNFEFDHEGKTGYPLIGAHAQARCLRCHNDRGPVKTFEAQGCVGCHEDVHNGDLGTTCIRCHDQRTWVPENQIELHNRTRFPLTAAHALVACQRCHPGARVGNFQPTDPDCVTCHMRDLQNTQNPQHIPLGWVDNCQRCHLPTRWEQATIQSQTAGQRRRR